MGTLVAENVVIDFSRARLTFPDTILPQVRLIYRNGVCAIWQEVRRPRSATRLHYFTNCTFEKGETARFPNYLVLEDGTRIEVVGKTGGCGCGSILKQFTYEQLLHPDLEQVP